MTQTNQAKIPLEIDGEIIYLDPNSAEGKALQRIQTINFDDPNQFTTLLEEGQEINIEVITERLRQPVNEFTVS
ncbi:hypothetical protein C7H19_00330 [Aphanothece hegewaldii CCALA 016]|uniref:Uncharacterized protein n=1 Tax=Aphanothece hegewaldii CCALA 016 TaxID=2107694 RepID=A0A2T1M366_9CHRO|nr:hypothetical protein [Aphanothece hegewaldii]PSF39272.1 hypothetical protein C7H19_00330 [Aphanothece hegewaldii CCALA 016]